VDLLLSFRLGLRNWPDDDDDDHHHVFPGWWEPSLIDPLVMICKPWACINQAALLPLLAAAKQQ
jgi:hypothetical protein